MVLQKLFKRYHQIKMTQGDLMSYKTFATIFLWLLLSLKSWAVVPSKILICGVCKNVAHCLHNDFQNIAALGNEFDDYCAIIYENNSTDNTKAILKDWANNNPRAILISENLSREELRQGARCFDKDENPSRMELIAKARNHVLEVALQPQFDDFHYVIMVDLDFNSPWPIGEIVRTIQQRGHEDWDCVSANGLNGSQYYDRYAFRNHQFPFGPEIFSEDWWGEIRRCPLYYSGDTWIPVYSAFGGLAIYRRSSLLGCSYVGYVTDDLSQVIRKILVSGEAATHQVQKYLNMIGAQNSPLETVPIIYQCNSGYHGESVCCEHVTLHASMILKGKGKLFINPQMHMRYY